MKELAFGCVLVGSAILLMFSIGGYVFIKWLIDVAGRKYADRSQR